MLAECNEIELVEGNADAVWYCPVPKEAASRIAGYIAFWHGVIVER